MNRPDGIRQLLSLMSDEERSRSRYIVRFRSGSAYRAFLLAARQTSIPFRPLPIIQAVSCTLSRPLKLSGRDAITSIEPDNKTASVHAIPVKTDKSRYIPWGVSRIKAPGAWRSSSGSRVKIAVIDTGIDYQHPDLRRAVVGGINLVFRNMPPYDDNGHGTHIAGTIAAEAEKEGVLGVAPGAQLYAVKAFDYNGTAFVSDIVYGIDWCVQNKIDIINMSFGMKTRSQSLEEAVKKAHRAGTIIIASSGNDGRNGIDFPARYPEVISVGATARSRTLAAFSNKSRKTDIYAPGDRIFSTWPRSRYSELSGTSMATSHVTGVAALLLGVKPGLKTDGLRILLQKSAIPLRTDEKELTAHTGEIDAKRAIQFMLGKSNASPAGGRPAGTGIKVGKVVKRPGKPARP